MEKVAGTDSLLFTTKVISELNYDGVIAIKFEKIIDKIDWKKITKMKN